MIHKTPNITIMTLALHASTHFTSSAYLITKRGINLGGNKKIVYFVLIEATDDSLVSLYRITDLNKQFGG